MTKLILLFPLLCITGAVALEWENFHLTYGIFSGMFSIPLTKAEALEQDYSLMVSDSDLNVDFYAYKKDPRVSIGYDSYGNIAGVRISFLKADVARTEALAVEKGVPFNSSFYENDPMYSSATYFDTDVYYNTVLFSSPELLRAGGRNGTVTTVGHKIYTKVTGDWSLMPKNECDAPSQNFTNSACNPTMGKHYFYKLRSTMDCINFKGLFMLYDGGEQVGLGITVYGFHSSSSSREWFEKPGRTIYEKTMPYDRPDCLTEWVEKLEATSLHFFFKKHPRLTFCFGGETEC